MATLKKQTNDPKVGIHPRNINLHMELLKFNINL